MATRRTAQQPPDLTGLVAAIGVVLAAAAAVFGYGGLPLALAGLVTAGWMARAPQFTGKKDRAGNPTAAHPGEAKAMRMFRLWRDLRWRLFTPTADWLPGKDPLASWFAGVLAALAAAAIPTPELPGWFPLVNAAVVAVLVWQVSATLRRFAADYDPSPGLRLGALRALPTIGRTWILLVVGAVMAAVVVATVVGMFIPADYANVYGPNARFVASWSLGLIATGAVLAPAWRKIALTQWRELVATRSAWEPRWQQIGLKDDSPWLVKHEVLGPVTVDTFEAPASTGAAYFCSAAITGKVVVALGANQRVFVISSPNLDGQGQPTPGTVHPTTFRVVYLPADQMPDLTDPDLDPALVEVVLEGAMAAACDAGGVFRYLLLENRLITDHTPRAAAAHPQDDGDEDEQEQFEDEQGGASPWAVWASVWAQPDGGGGMLLRSTVAGPLAGQLQVPVLVDHRLADRLGMVFVGPAANPDVVIDPSSGFTQQQMVEIEREDAWRGRWAATLKQGVNAPVPQMALYAEARIPSARWSDTRVHYLPFVTLEGEPPDMYFGNESKLKTTLQASPFVAITGFPGGGAGARAGDRHPQAIAVIWSQGPVPDGPQNLPPNPPRSRSDVQRWILAGRFNEAFTAARLARPEVAGVQCLTAPDSRGHIWKVDLRLYGGVTLSDVRGAAARIRGALGSSWLRIAAAEDGCTIYAGEQPAKVKLARPGDQKVLTALDWEQAWLDSKVSGSGGLLPKLMEAAPLPRNPKVQSLDFKLPAGLAEEDIRSAVSKLRTATSNAFIEVRPGESADEVRLLVCEVNPLPSMVEFDFDYIDGVDDLPFASSVEGEPVSYDYMVDPHLLIVGGSGSGKSATLQGLLYSIIARGCDVYIADPTKGGADFRFALPWVKSFTADVFEASAMMDAIYAEVLRRKNLNSENGVGSYTELPEDIRPRHAVVVLDEFTSLMIADQLPPKPEPDDEEGQAEYAEALALKAAKINIGAKAGRIAREARSAGVTLLLATQRLTAKTLDAIPGAQDLRTNMARMILGKATFGELQSALKEPTSAPPLGDVVPRGRGLLEVSGERIRIIQCWYIDSIQQRLAAELEQRRPKLEDSERVDLTPFMRKPAESGQDAGRRRRPAAPSEPIVEDLGELSIEWDDAVFSEAATDVQPEPEQAGGVTDEDEALDSQGLQWPTVQAQEAEVSFELERDDGVPLEEFDGLTSQRDVAPAAVPAESAALDDDEADDEAGGGELSRTDTVLMLDVDRTVSPLSKPQWADAALMDSPHGQVWYSASMLARLGALPVPVVWATDWEDEASATFDALLGRSGLEHLRPGGPDLGWWKIGALLTWLDKHPEVEHVVFVDDMLTDVDDLDIEHGETLADALDARGVRVTLVSPDDGLSQQDVESIERAVGVEPQMTSEAPTPVLDPEPVEQAPVEQAPEASSAGVPREKWTPPGSRKPKTYVDEW